MLLHKTFQKYQKSHIPPSYQEYEHRAKEWQPTSPSSGEWSPLLPRQWETQKVSCFTDGNLDYNLFTAAGDPCMLLLFQIHVRKVSSMDVPMSIFFFGSSVTFLICALQDTEETDCSSFHKKLRDVSLERQRALYSNAHTHTHPAARHPNTVRVSGDVNQAAGLLWESRSIITLITEQTHVFHQILVCGFHLLFLFFFLIRATLNQSQICLLPKYLSSNAHLSIVQSVLPIQAKNNTCQYTFVHLTYKITMKITRGIKQLL